jgi:hypothetical protein
MPKRHLIIYCDESAKKGRHFSNFYGGALIRANERDAIEELLISTKNNLNLFNELKWQRITDNYKDKYIAFLDVYFSLIIGNRLKIRIMFTQNQYRPSTLTDEHMDNEYFILYYQFIKHAFGLTHCNSNNIERVFVALLLDQVPASKTKFDKFKDYIQMLNNSTDFIDSRIHIPRDAIGSIDSCDHVILQGLDIILGAMNFKLNDMHLAKADGSRRRGKRTRAKELVYKYINQKIRSMYPRFNIGVSTSSRNDIKNRWKHPYRHWRFRAAEFEVDQNYSSKNKAPLQPT